ncbi:MAG: DUF72 domain-containing protein [Actinomycetes bacterium]
MPVLIGTSGWQYADWREPFYAGVPARRWFEHVLDNFATVELNVTFYRLPKREVFAGWHARSPRDAVITVKASRYLTHIKRLRDPAGSVAMLMERIEPLREKLGPILLQLPPDLRIDIDALAATMAAFPSNLRLAVEPRHASWWVDELRDLLTAHNAALVWADRKARPVSPLWRTADWGYLRLHEGATKVWPFYGRRSLATWAGRIAEQYDDGLDVFVYFNNDPNCAAVDNAITFADELGRLGRTTTRVPEEHPRTIYNAS